MHDYLSWPADLRSMPTCNRRRSSASLRWSLAKAGAEARANGSVFSPRWRGISGLPTRHRTWYGENPVAQGEAREIAVRLGNCGDFWGIAGDMT
jgi:hypothetical protein